jgi:hypothetical protein
MQLPTVVKNIIFDYKQEMERGEHMNEHFKKWKHLNEQFEAYQFMSGGLKRMGVHSLFAFNWRFRNQMAVRHIVHDIEKYTQFVKFCHPRIEM